MYPFKKEAEEVLKEKRRKQCDYRSPELGAATSQGVPAAPTDWERQGMDSALKSLKKTDPANARISNFWLPEI